MIFTKNMKLGIMYSDAEMVVELRRPTNKEKNAFLGSQLECTEERPSLRMDYMDGLRIRLFDELAVSVHIMREGNREDLVDEEGRVLGPKDLTDDLKSKVIIKVLEQNPVYLKN